MIAIVTVLFAFPLGFFVRSRLAANVGYIAVYMYAFTFQGIYLMRSWVGGDDSAFPSNPDDLPLQYLAVSLGIFLRFFLLHVLLGDGFEASMTERLWQLQSVNCGVCSFEHLRDPPPLEGPGPWRCRAWMASEPGP